MAEVDGAKCSLQLRRLQPEHSLRDHSPMSICHAHNARQDAAPARADLVKPYGLKVSLKPGDPFRKLLGDDWSRTHWFASSRERDDALLEMSRKHEYSRPGDRPAHVYEKIEVSR